MGSIFSFIKVAGLLVTIAGTSVFSIAQASGATHMSVKKYSGGPNLPYYQKDHHGGSVGKRERYDGIRYPRGGY